MSANSAAFDHVNGFRWRQGDPSLAESEARLYDLGVLRSVLEESVEIAVADARADGVTWAKIGDALGVKASGGIRDGKFAVELLEAGATRLGLSSSARVLDTL